MEEEEGERERINARKLEPESGFGDFEEWVTVVRRRSGKSLGSSRTQRSPLPVQEPLPARRSLSPSSPAACRVGVVESGKPDYSGDASQSPEQVPEISLWDRLGNACALDVEASEVPWDNLFSLHHTKYTSSNECSEDEINKALEARVIHNSIAEWQLIKDAAQKAQDISVANGDEVGEVTCSELLEALELSRCLFLMNYIHGSPLVENPNAFDSREAAESTAASLGRVLILDLILRNEDRLPCPSLGWRGNPANLLFANKVASANMDALDKAYDSSIRRFNPLIVKNLERKKVQRAISLNGRLGYQVSESTTEVSDDLSDLTARSTSSQGTEFGKSSDFHVVAIDSGVPRRPPAGKRAKDQENYPRVVELIINNFEFSSNLLYEVSFGKLGVPEAEHTDVPSDSCSCFSESDVAASVYAFRAGFRGALRDLQSLHVFLLTLYQKLEGLLRIVQSIINKIYSEDESAGSDSPSHTACSSSQFQADSSDPETRKCLHKSSASRESVDISSPICRENWNGRYFKGSDSSRCLRLTTKLRDFHKITKILSYLKSWSSGMRRLEQRLSNCAKKTTLTQDFLKEVIIALLSMLMS